MSEVPVILAEVTAADWAAAGSGWTHLPYLARFRADRLPASWEAFFSGRHHAVLESGRTGSLTIAVPAAARATNGPAGLGGSPSATGGSGTVAALARRSSTIRVRSASVCASTAARSTFPGRRHHPRRALRGAARRHEEHVTAADERLGAASVEDGARVDLAADLERDTGRHVGLDQAGDHVHAGALGGQNQVNACGTGLLRQTGNQLFDFKRFGDVIIRAHF